ncbi:MAG: flavin reductase [Candidatus Delongbacteria bacterium]|nr:flavin reductase [Candidatus Delongbacteria bacterium]MBN2835255.1 flavin reductase [Candidatus Delongbacteria bacterium]
MNKIDPYKFDEKIFDLIDKQWMLITAGTPDNCNTMTASWAGFGVLWNKKVCFTFVRPTRHTYNFTEENDLFTLTFFDEKYRDALKLLGTVSGKNRDKISESGLTIEQISETTGFKEARLTMVCKKVYWQDIDNRNFLVSEIENSYPQKDYHRMYVGEILEILER